MIWVKLCYHVTSCPLQPTRDATGAAIAVFTANRHFPTQTTHQTTLQVKHPEIGFPGPKLQSRNAGQHGLVLKFGEQCSVYSLRHTVCRSLACPLTQRGNRICRACKYLAGHALKKPDT